MQVQVQSIGLLSSAVEGFTFFRLPPRDVVVMALGHYMRENRLSPRELPRRKAPYDNGKQDDAAQQCEAKCLRTKVERHNASIRTDEESGSLVKSVKRCFNLALDAPSGNHDGSIPLQVEPRAAPISPYKR